MPSGNAGVLPLAFMYMSAYADHAYEATDYTGDDDDPPDGEFRGPRRGAGPRCPQMYGAVEYETAWADETLTYTHTYGMAEL